jgi:hypothetical protein
MWAQIAKTALAKKSGGNGVAERMDAKLLTGKFFMERMLPESSVRLARITSGADTMMLMPAEMF